ncbi:MAG: UbiA family prenyltransferase [Candidatus Micrarchaeia archaeon]
MASLSAYVRLFRIEHAAMLSAAVLIGILISQNAEGAAISLSSIALALAVPFFIEMGSFALNDYFDVETDKANKRKDRPIASGEITKETALALSGAAYVLGIACAVPLPTSALYITLLFAALSLFYNWKLKLLPLVGNLYIAASMAIPFLFGNLVVSSSISPQLWAISLVAFVAGLGREIVKSAEDVEGDVKHRNARTLPALVGKKTSCYFAALLYAALVPLAFLPFLFGLKANILAAGLVMLTAISFAAMAYLVASDQKKEDLEACRKSSLLALGVGLLGYAASLI